MFSRSAFAAVATKLSAPQVLCRFPRSLSLSRQPHLAFSSSSLTRLPFPPTINTTNFTPPPTTFTVPTPATTTTRKMSSLPPSAAQRLAGKTVLITGASSGIGRSCALEFARAAPQDLRLVLTARREDRLRELAEEIRKEVGEGVKVKVAALDVSDREAVRGFVGGLDGEWGGVDVLVNNA